MSCYQKLVEKKLSVEEQERVAELWSKGSAINFHKITVYMSKVDVVRNGSDSDFIVNMYESILDRILSDDEIEGLIK